MSIANNNIFPTIPVTQSTLFAMYIDKKHKEIKNILGIIFFDIDSLKAYTYKTIEIIK